MVARLLLAGGLVLAVSTTPASAQVKTATPETIDWIAGACTADQAFGMRFGEAPPRSGSALSGGQYYPFEGLFIRTTEKTGRLFLAESIGMFEESPGSTQSDRQAGRLLFEAVDERVVQLGTFSNREYDVRDDGDIHITYSNPVGRPESRVQMTVSYMLGGTWVGCTDYELLNSHWREMNS